MNRRVLTLISLLIVAAAIPAAAQSSSANVGVSASNSGAFTLALTTSTYNFGTVSSVSTANSGDTETLTGDDSSGTSVTFTSGAAAIGWTVTSAPSRTVRIFNSSAGTTSGWGTTSNLKLVMDSVPVGSTACTEIALSAVGDPTGGNTCTNGALVHSVANVGRGGNAKTGNLRLKMTVADADVTGAATWTVSLTAIGL